MSIFKKLFGSREPSPAQKILGAMQPFTEAALLMVPPSDYENDEMRTKRVFVFLFEAIDCLIQHHGITDDAKLDLLTTYLGRTFPSMTDAGIQSAVSFLYSASSHPTWIPIMQRGGQTMVDWSRGDAVAPSRLLKVIHYGMDDQP
jgi:hypothetical protein